MLEKGMQKTWKVLQNGARMWAGIEKKLSKTMSEKRCEKEHTCKMGRRAGAFLRLIISSRLVFRPVFRLVLVSFHVSGRLVTSRNSSLLPGICFRIIFESSDASWRLVTVLWRLVYHVCLPRQCTSIVRNVMSMDRQRRQKYRCRKFRYRVLNARSLKRPMLHTSSRLVAGCEFKG